MSRSRVDSAYVQLWLPSLKTPIPNVFPKDEHILLERLIAKLFFNSAVIHDIICAADHTPWWDFRL